MPFVFSTRGHQHEFVTKSSIESGFQKIDIEFDRFCEFVKTASQIFCALALFSELIVSLSFLQPRRTQIVIELRVSRITLQGFVELLNRLIKIFLCQIDFAEGVTDGGSWVLSRGFEES